jgi:predicted ATP-dependent endonuclease of OLD family
MPHLDDIPLPLVGKGEQNNVKIKLAMDASVHSNIYLIEEPENHLSFPNLSKLIDHISSESTGKQLVLTTHSSFVLNKLGVESVLLFNGQECMPLSALDPSTHDYFLKLPGHDTLRLILAAKAILVEGPSDELVVQKVFFTIYKKLPLAAGVDVISVKSLAFRRFLEIAKILKLDVSVVTDNDGDIVALEKKYASFKDCSTIKICFDADPTCKTLEPQLLKANGLELLNDIFETEFSSGDALLKYMAANKTDCALKIFSTQLDVKIPDYITKAISG